jgi:hypothetical protein
MNPLVPRLKSRDCVIVPAKYRPGTLTDSYAGVSAGNRSLIVSSGRQPSSKIEASKRKPVHTITRWYGMSLVTSPARTKLTVTR